jgi:hypothetical protein
MGARVMQWHGTCRSRVGVVEVATWIKEPCGEVANATPDAACAKWIVGMPHL